jgi:hypothetical protein
LRRSLYIDRSGAQPPAECWGLLFTITSFRDLGIVSRIGAMDGQLYIGYYDPQTMQVLYTALLLVNEYGQYERTFMF